VAAGRRAERRTRAPCSAGDRTSCPGGVARPPYRYPGGTSRVPRLAFLHSLSRWVQARPGLVVDRRGEPVLWSCCQCTRSRILSAMAWSVIQQATPPARRVRQTQGRAPSFDGGPIRFCGLLSPGWSVDHVVFSPPPGGVLAAVVPVAVMVAGWPVTALAARRCSRGTSMGPHVQRTPGRPALDLAPAPRGSGGTSSARFRAPAGRRIRPAGPDRG